MNKTLANRIGRIEDHLRESWQAQHSTSCPREWTRRLAAFSPRYNEILEVGQAAAKELGQYQYEVDTPPTLHAGTLFGVLITHSRMAQFVKNIEEWKPTEAEWRSMELFGELKELGDRYIAATGDLAPCHLPWWKDPREGRLHARGRRGWGARR